MVEPTVDQLRTAAQIDRREYSGHGRKGEMKIHSKDFRVRSGKKLDLKKWPTMVKPFCKTKELYQTLLENHVTELSALQPLHCASNRYALLLIFVDKGVA